MVVNMPLPATPPPGPDVPARLFKYCWPCRADLQDGVQPLPNAARRVTWNSAFDFLSLPHGTDPDTTFLVGNDQSMTHLTGAMLKDLLDDASDLIAALGICGYHVPYLEYSPPPRFSSGQGRYVRVDLTQSYPVVSMMVRDSTTSEVGILRVGLEPMVANYATAGMPVTEADVEDYARSVISSLARNSTAFASARSIWAPISTIAISSTTAACVCVRSSRRGWRCLSAWRRVPNWSSN